MQSGERERVGSSRRGDENSSYRRTHQVERRAVRLPSGAVSRPACQGDEEEKHTDAKSLA
jgi:hypothetical protein